VVNRFLVLLATLMLAAWGLWGAAHDAGRRLARSVRRAGHHPHQLPGPGAADRREPGHLSAGHDHAVGAGAKTVRGFSFFGDSFVYVLFEDGTDLYWARSRVLEYLNQVQGRLPAAAKSALGPDATGVGWIFQYALVDRSGRNDLSQLRALQDWFLKYELKSLPGVAEVATVGGMNKQYQVVLDPLKLAAHGITHGRCARP
jgi:Cu(I)/Ag(I) efflux system membrane protein CusA/SilA